jgi:hypothetical protein
LEIFCLWSFFRSGIFAQDEPRSNLFHLSSLSSQRYLILHLERLGLANRLRSLADWYHIAGLSNRRLLLSWVPTAECNVTFDGLFEDGPSDFDVLSSPFPIGNFEAISAASILATHSHLSFETLLTHDTLSRAEVNYFFDHSERFLLFQQIDVIFTNFDAPIVLPGTPCPAHLTMRSSFYSSLIPISEIRSTVKEIHSNYVQNNPSLSSPPHPTAPPLALLLPCSPVCVQSDDWSSCSGS